MIHNQEKKQSIETDPEAVEMIKLITKNIKIAYKYALHI